jgi:hypothetical protein
MSIAQWTFYVIVPFALSVAGVLYGEIFRRRQQRGANANVNARPQSR